MVFSWWFLDLLEIKQFFSLPFPSSWCTVVLQLGAMVLFSLLNQPNQEVDLLLKCKFHKLRVNVPFPA